MGWDTTFDEEEAKQLVKLYLESHTNCQSDSVVFEKNSGNNNISYISGTSTDKKFATMHLNLDASNGSCSPVLITHPIGFADPIKTGFKTMVEDIYAGEISQHGGYQEYLKHRYNEKHNPRSRTPEEQQRYQENERKRADLTKKVKLETDTILEKNEVKENLLKCISAATAQLLYKTAQEQDNPLYHARSSFKTPDTHPYVVNKKFSIASKDGLLLSPETPPTVQELTNYIRSDEFKLPKKLATYLESKNFSKDNLADFIEKNHKEYPKQKAAYDQLVESNNSVKKEFNITENKLSQAVYENDLRAYLKLKQCSTQRIDEITAAFQKERMADPVDYFLETGQSKIVNLSAQYANTILPFRDSEGIINSVQFISSNGTKSFLPHASTTDLGFVFNTTHIPKDNKPKTIIAGEGWATCKEISDLIEKQQAQTKSNNPIYVLAVGSANTMNKLLTQYLEPEYNANIQYLVDNDAKNFKKIAETLANLKDLPKAKQNVQNSANVGLKVAIDFVNQNPDNANKISLLIPKFNYKSEDTGSDWNDLSLKHGRASFENAFNAEIIEAVERKKAHISELERAVPFYNEQASFYSLVNNTPINGIDPKDPNKPIILTKNDYQIYERSLSKFAEKYDFNLEKTYSKGIEVSAPKVKDEPQQATSKIEPISLEPQTAKHSIAAPINQQPDKDVKIENESVQLQTSNTLQTADINTPKTQEISLTEQELKELKVRNHLEPDAPLSHDEIKMIIEIEKSQNSVADSKSFSDEAWMKSGQENITAIIVEDVKALSAAPQVIDMNNFDTYAYTLALANEYLQNVVDTQALKVKGDLDNEQNTLTQIYQVILDPTMSEHAQKTIENAIKNPNVSDANHQQSLQELARLCDPHLIKHTQDIHNEMTGVHKSLVNNYLLADPEIQTNYDLSNQLRKNVEDTLAISDIDEKRAIYKEFTNMIKDPLNTKWINEAVEKLDELQSTYLRQEFKTDYVDVSQNQTIQHNYTP